MQNSVIASIFNRFAYLSADVRAPITRDHPNIQFQEHNRYDEHAAERYALDLADLAVTWANTDDIDSDPEFAKAIAGLETVLKATSATSLMILHDGELVVERPGIEIDNRRYEISSLCKRSAETWQQMSDTERRSFANLALIGLGPIQVEVVNYLDTLEIPRVLGTMLSRLDSLVPPASDEPQDAKTYLKSFFELEQEKLDKAGLVRIGMPMGTRPRIYVPPETVAAGDDAYKRAKDALMSGRNFEESVANFLGVIWEEFADEGFFVMHEGSNVNAYALVGGCCYHYHAAVDYNTVPATVTQATPLRFVSTVGEIKPAEWRRDPDKLCFDNATDALTDFRKSVMRLEALPEQERAEEGEAGYLKKAASRLLNRQINYNISHVINGQMERISSVEWSPNMCRDRFGLIYNPPHALGGVGEMFRSLLTFGDRSSQFRTWREMDGTHGLEDIKPFLGYTKALDEFLISQKRELNPTNSPSVK